MAGVERVLRRRARLQPWMLGAVLAAGVTLGASAEAPTTEAPRPAAAAGAIYVGEDASAEVATRVSHALAMLSPPVTLGSPPLHLGEVLPEGAPAVIGATAVAHCDGKPVDLATYRGHIDLMRSSVVDPSRPSPPPETIEQALRCLSEPGPAEELAQVRLLRGVAALQAGDQERAQALFTDALTIAPSLQWHAAFPPEGHESFHVAAKSVLAAKRVPLRILAPTGAEVWIDGQLVELPMQATSVPPGPHLVQYRLAGAERATGVLVTVSAGEEVLVVDAGAFERTRADDPAYAARAGALLGALVGAQAEMPAVLVSLSPKVEIWRYNATTGGAEPLKVSTRIAAVASGKQGNPEQTRARLVKALPVTLVAGAAMIVAGGVMTGAMGVQMDQMDEDVQAGVAPFPHVDDPEPTEEMLANKQTYDRAIGLSRVGIGLMAAGGVCLGVSIPLGVWKGQQARQVTMSTTLLTTGDPRDPAAPPLAVQGATFRITIR